jgi:four helix bundle suffix protein
MKSNEDSEKFIPPHGGYSKLITCQKAEIIFDATMYFTNRFFKKSDRTADQMEQAARSGKQNLAEASMASAVSKKTEIILTKAAKASLEELLTDYEDFLRTRSLSIWEKDHRLNMRFRALNRTPNATYQTYIKAIENESPEICANSVICLIKIAIYLLARQIKYLEKDFMENGGLHERMEKARNRNRGKE